MSVGDLDVAVQYQVGVQRVRTPGFLGRFGGFGVVASYSVPVWSNVSFGVLGGYEQRRFANTTQYDLAPPTAETQVQRFGPFADWNLRVASGTAGGHRFRVAPQFAVTPPTVRGGVTGSALWLDVSYVFSTRRLADFIGFFGEVGGGVGDTIRGEPGSALRAFLSVGTTLHL